MASGDTAALHASAAANSKLAELPPLARAASRLNEALDRLEGGIGNIIDAGHRTADRMGGEAPTVGAETARSVPDYGPPSGNGGQIGEVEVTVMRAERLFDELTRRAEVMMNRLTYLG